MALNAKYTFTNIIGENIRPLLTFDKQKSGTLSACSHDESEHENWPTYCQNLTATTWANIVLICLSNIRIECVFTSINNCISPCFPHARQDQSKSILSTVSEIKINTMILQLFILLLELDTWRTLVLMTVKATTISHHCLLFTTTWAHHWSTDSQTVHLNTSVSQG